MRLGFGRESFGAWRRAHATIDCDGVQVRLSLLDAARLMESLLEGGYEVQMPPPETEDNEKD